ncbi:MAG: SUMF1/EgtB/PvdO family nonheme iron enzyme [Cyclobacteriaceae bacterium]
MKRTTLLLLGIFLLASESFASDLEIKNVRSMDRRGMDGYPVSIIFDIEWNNSWNNKKNRDEVWVFMKFNTPWNNHVKLLPTGHKVLQTRKGVSPTIEVSEDSLGFFIYSSEAYRGDVNFKLQILLDTTNQQISRNRLTGMKVHGLEMVYIPEGSFSVGSPDQDAIQRAALYQSDGNGDYKGTFIISDESEITVAPENNALYYWSERDLYNGDQKGPIPADFPKGFDAFHVMKYELTQGQYAAFLNSLPARWTYNRSPIGGIDYYKKRGGIRLEKGEYMAESPDRPMNFVSFTDGLAFTDWAALRPITELEYEKAARGPSKPLPAEFAWGTNNYDRLERYVNPDAEITLSNGFSESQLTDETRPVFGASYYWVMDLSGSVWEKVITVGNPVGRAFKGTHGDGKLEFGSATNVDWPTSDDEVGGFGYRGGGYYDIGTGYSDFNPHSPIGYRYYGAWSGGPRSIAYGFRAGRSAK